jgi:para-nitrobenzyl esterase
MVWIHGGGYQHGSSVEIFSYDGENLSQFGDVVVVSLNHRLHALGYMDLSGYDAERYRYSGNLGTADLVQALRWIHENIAAFGGDPQNVTLFGQSGGGGKIQALLQTPAADGLYHKVSMQSGVEDQSRPGVSQAQARLTADYVVKNLGLTKDRIQDIEMVPFHRLATAICQAREQLQQEQGIRLNWAPVVDGDYYLGNGMVVGFRPEVRSIPALVGNVFGEFMNNTIDPLRAEYGCKCDWDEAAVQRRLTREFGSAKETVCQAFAAAYPDMPLANAVFCGTEPRRRHLNVAKGLAAAGVTVYNWLLTLELPADGGSTPWHNAEEPFVFHNASYLESTFIPGVTEELENQVAGAWVAFAYTGDPNHKGIPTWKPITADQTATMRFDRTCEMMYGEDEAFVDLVESLHLPPRRADGPKLAYGGGPRHPDGR